MSDSTVHVEVALPQVAGRPTLNKRLRDTADGLVKSFRTRARAESSRRPGRYHALTVGWQLLGTSKQSTGIQVWAAEQHGLGVDISRSSVWYDVSHKRVLSLSDLFVDSAWPAVRRSILTAAFGQQTGERRSRTDVSKDRERYLHALAFGFSADGSLVLTPSRATWDFGDKPLSIHLASAALVSRLSNAGTSARAAAHGPRPPTNQGPVDCVKRRCVALTFDDGPGPYTAELVAMLQQRRVPATFFLVGDRVRQSSDLVATMSSAGLEIGNQSSSHVELTFVAAGPMTIDLRNTSRAIQAVTGRRTTLLRPPYGARNRIVDRVSKRLGMAEILWDVDTLDWRTDNPATVRHGAVSAARRGSIILLHDVGHATVAAVPKIIADLRRRGFVLVTVSELLGERLRPGEVYRQQTDTLHR
ncbi:MAG TPA: polysaccharide deacetylase family protein [Propionibacteriaceae bacterium]